MYGSPIYGADVSGSLTDQDVNVSVLIFLLICVLLLLSRECEQNVMHVC